MAEKNTKPVQGPGGRGPKGPRPKVENPGKLFMRLLAYIKIGRASCRERV